VKTIEIKTSSLSRVLVGETIKNLENYLPGDRKPVIITDKLIAHLYSESFPGEIPVIKIEMGEKNKTLEAVQYIFEKFIELEIDRSSFVLGIGGGIICDVVGFAASIYMRGIGFGFVSSSLLSQVDASVGGKNGVNFKGYKNMVGVFKQPEFVICDINMLNTLEETEYISGFAEIVKAGAIQDKALFEYLENNFKAALQKDKNVMEHVIHESVKIKANVVKKDEREANLRQILNFGHTFAHSFEKTGGVSHGQAVSLGMVLAARLSVQRGLLEKDAANRLINLLENLNLPVKMQVDPEKFFQAMKKDKKRRGDQINLILLDKIGNAVIQQVPVNSLKEIVYDLC